MAKKRKSSTKKKEVTVGEIKAPTSFYDKDKYNAYLEELNKLREDGENKVLALRNEIRDILLNKQLDKDTRRKLVRENLKQLKKARINAKKHKKEVDAVIKEAAKTSHAEYYPYFKSVKVKSKGDIKQEKILYRQLTATQRRAHAKRIKELKAKIKDKNELKISLKTENIAYSARIHEAKTARNEVINNAKQAKYNAFMDKYGYNAKLKNDKHSLTEKLQFRREQYILNFNPINWLIKNALYVLIILVFLALTVFTMVDQGGWGLLSADSILTALVQIAPKIFFALGVGGLILLGGTDLSIGRLTGVGVSFTLMILTAKVGGYQDNNGLAWFGFLSSAPAAVKVICALFVSIFFCTLFTTFAGFFTAKFKMHPFISTLAVQLISYGLFQMFWSAQSSFTPDEGIIDALRGPKAILLVVYAVIAIAVVWFIWNKTKFGKHIYAVGGNQEAATVSGIDPFKITLLAFVMAGILYGLGGFVQAVQTGTGNFNSGYGTETDAIAACVIGGISFSGGIGKVSGAVIGALILGFLTHAFGYIGIDANLQMLIKGLIILIAVALDCVKYLRKK